MEKKIVVCNSCGRPTGSTAHYVHDRLFCANCFWDAAKKNITVESKKGDKNGKES
jgi:hypothetical protein